MKAPIPDNDWSMLHFATGILMRIAKEHGRRDVRIYHDLIHVRIEFAGREMTNEDLGIATNEATALDD